MGVAGGKVGVAVGGIGVAVGGTGVIVGVRVNAGVGQAMGAQSAGMGVVDGPRDSSLQPARMDGSPANVKNAAPRNLAPNRGFAGRRIEHQLTRIFTNPLLTTRSTELRK